MFYCILLNNSKRAVVMTLLLSITIMVFVVMVMIVAMASKAVGIFDRNRNDDDPHEDQQQDHQNHFLGSVLVLLHLQSAVWLTWSEPGPRWRPGPAPWWTRARRSRTAD